MSADAISAATEAAGSGGDTAPLGDRPDVDGFALAIPDEPSELKVALRRALLDGRPPAGLPVDLDVAAWLWGTWGPVLGPLGFGRDQFTDALGANQRELWLWLMGDRQWGQFASGLVGRISRRLPR